MQELVIEANVVFQALIKRGFILKLIRLLSKKGYKLYSPKFLSEEVDKRKGRIMKFSDLTLVDLELVISSLFKFIKEISDEEYSSFIKESSELFPEHTKDVPYFALALSKNIPLWSDEKRHKLQSKVKVLSTNDILKLSPA